MPLTQKGEKIERAMVKKYGEKKGESVLYASRNAGTIKGIDMFKGTGGNDINTNSFVPGGKRR